MRPHGTAGHECDAACMENAYRPSNLRSLRDRIAAIDCYTAQGARDAGLHFADISTEHVKAFRDHVLDMIDQALQVETTAERCLGNLLAIIHGDGGHYQAKHGDDKATEDAVAKYYATRFDALCPHGIPLAENICGPCSQGRPNRPAVKATAPQCTCGPSDLHMECPVHGAEARSTPCEHLRSEFLAEKQKDGEPLFQMHKCLDCKLIFRVRSSLKTSSPHDDLGVEQS